MVVILIIERNGVNHKLSSSKKSNNPIRESRFSQGGRRFSTKDKSSLHYDNSKKLLYRIQIRNLSIRSCF